MLPFEPKKAAVLELTDVVGDVDPEASIVADGYDDRDWLSAARCGAACTSISSGRRSRRLDASISYTAGSSPSGRVRRMRNA